MLKKRLIHTTIARKAQSGFTIVELIVIMVILGILSTIVIVSLQGLEKRALDTQHKADASILERAIVIARVNADLSLYKINGLPSTDTTVSKCLTSTTEPKDRPKTDICWTTYYNSLDKISAASGINLAPFKRGDKRGNPYTIAENEERTGCTADYIGWFTGNGIETSGGISLEPYTLPCQ